MKVLSWNIFFDTYNLETRTQKISELSIHTDADIILFQEVRDSILNFLLHKMYDGGYILPDLEVQTRRIKSSRYGTLTFVKSTFSDINVTIIQHAVTEMSRDILETVVNGISFYNVHLESMNNPQFATIREIQLGGLKGLVENNLAIAAGDFNIKYRITDNTIVELPTCNTYFASRFNSKYSHSAPYDRVISNKLLKCNILEYVGNDKYDMNGIPGYCSDHNGILFSCDFNV